LGETIRYKAPLVAQCLRQVEGLEFAKTFAPVASLSSVRIVLAIAGTHRYAVHQMDVVTPFLGSKLHEEMYVHVPLGVLGCQRMSRLNCSLYGLKQSPQCWYTTINELLVSHLGFRPVRFDCCIYIHTNGTILALYINNMLLAGRKLIVSDLQKKLKGRFDIVDLGLVHHFVGRMVSRPICTQNVYITQEGYNMQVLERFGMSDCKPVATLMDKDSPLEREKEEQACNKRLHRPLIGSHGWIAIGTRPDISFAVFYLRRFWANPSWQHLVWAKRVQCYLAETRYLQYGLWGNMPLQMPVNGFVDANFIGDTCILKSTTGYILPIGSTVIQWHSKKQSITETTKADAEFIAYAMAI